MSALLSFKVEVTLNPINPVYPGVYPGVECLGLGVGQCQDTEAKRPIIESKTRVWEVGQDRSLVMYGPH